MVLNGSTLLLLWLVSQVGSAGFPKHLQTVPVANPLLP